jgi:hypothetical protein
VGVKLGLSHRGITYTEGVLEQGAEKISGPKREESGENFSIRSYIIYIRHQILLE